MGKGVGRELSAAVGSAPERKARSGSTESLSSVKQAVTCVKQAGKSILASLSRRAGQLSRRAEWGRSLATFSENPA